MFLSAPILTTLNRCERRLSIEKTFKVLRVRPKELFDRLLREAVFAISNGANPHDVAEAACTLFLETAARPGLDILSDPYTISQDFCAMLRTVLESVSREVLLTVKRGGLIKIGDDQWQLQAFRDDSGVLHRWTSVDSWSEDAQYREMHSWHVFADCAAAGQGMWLHVVEIGRQSRGHQNSPWCRCFKHPAIAKHFRFRHTDGSPLEGGWKSVFYQDSTDNDPKTWVDLMQRDGVNLIHHIQIRDPDPGYVKGFRADVPLYAKEISEIPADWQSVRMRRTSCDVPVCPWQNACYAPPGLVNIEALGGFAKLQP